MAVVATGAGAAKDGVRGRGRVLVKGSARGAILKSETPINFLGMVDKGTGVIRDSGHELFGRSIGGRILAFPSGAGSSVGAYTIYSIKSSGSAPLAMICQKADITVATGCAVADIPLVTVPDEEFEALRDGEEVLLDTGSDRLISRSGP